MVPLLLLPFALLGLYLLYKALAVLFHFFKAWKRGDKEAMKKRFFPVLLILSLMTYILGVSSFNDYKEEKSLNQRVEQKGSSRLDEEHLDTLIATLSWALKGTGLKLSTQSYLMSFRDNSLYTSDIRARVKTDKAFIKRMKEKLIKQNEHQYIWNIGVINQDGGGSDTTIVIEDENKGIIVIKVSEWLD